MTWNKFSQFLIRFYQGEFPHLRLGQAFINTFYPSVIHPELFYCEDNHKAVEMIIEQYIKK